MTKRHRAMVRSQATRGGGQGPAGCWGRWLAMRRRPRWPVAAGAGAGVVSPGWWPRRIVAGWVMAKVYVSSTIADLKRERRAVMEWLRAARHQAVDSYLPGSDTVRESCL